jgi:hypothetical protein
VPATPARAATAIMLLAIKLFSDVLNHMLLVLLL